MIKGLVNRHLLITVSLMLMATFSLSSCETLKKKFTRHKKGENQQTELQPVLEPQDYPSPDKNPPDVYKQHYALIKVWYKDLWTGIEQPAIATDMTVRYSIKQMLDQLEQMKPLLKSEKAAGLGKLQDLLKFYQTSLDHPRIMRNYSRIQSDLREFDRFLRDQYSFDAIKDDLISS
jgi:hypothetical protein